MEKKSGSVTNPTLRVPTPGAPGVSVKRSVRNGFVEDGKISPVLPSLPKTPRRVNAALAAIAALAIIFLVYRCSLEIGRRPVSGRLLRRLATKNGGGGHEEDRKGFFHGICEALGDEGQLQVNVLPVALDLSPAAASASTEAPAETEAPSKKRRKFAYENQGSGVALPANQPTTSASSASHGQENAPGRAAPLLSDLPERRSTLAKAKCTKEKRPCELVS